jgi:hypothetical protein
MYALDYCKYARESGFYFSNNYRIISNESFSGNGEIWVRIGN